MRGLLVASLGIACCCGTPLARAEGLFAGGKPIPLDAPGHAMIAVDLDDDGHPDAAVAHEAAGKASLLHWDPASKSFSSPVLLDVGLSPVYLASGDVDGDGSKDVLVVNFGSSSVSVLNNSGDRGFTVSTEIRVPGSGARMAQVADFDRDGILDVAVANESSRNLAVLFGDGKGDFPRHREVSVGEKPHSLASGDFDGDGSVDLAAPLFEDSSGEGKVHWFPGKGDGTFGELVRTPVGSNSALRYSATGDLDSDGRLDLTVNDLGGTLFRIRSIGRWAFDIDEFQCCDGRRETEMDSGSTYSVLQSVDVESDGDLDLLVRVVRHQEAGLRVYENDGRGAFSPREDVFVDIAMGAPVLADFDGDGWLDVLATWTEPQLVLLSGEASGRLPVKASVPLNALPKGILSFREAGGRLRIVAYGTSSLHILDKDPAGLLQLVRSEDLSGLSIQDAVAGDFDGMPGDELALLDLARGNIVLVSTERAQGAANVVELPAGILPTRLAAADFDDDGLSDLIVARWTTRSVTVFLGPGTRAGAPKRSYELQVGAEPTALEAADLDGDRNADLLVASKGGVKLFHGDGKGDFVEGGPLFQGFDAARLRVADIDGDGVVDGVAVGGTRLSVLFGSSREADSITKEVDLGFVVRDLDVGDVNGDGFADIALAAEDRNAVAVVIVATDHKLSTPDLYATGVSPRGVLLMDADDDGLLDTVTADFLSRSVSVLRGLRGKAATRFRRGDVYADGALNLTDAIAVLSALFLGKGPFGCTDAADANDDGTVNLTDPVHLLNHLFQGGPAPPEPGPLGCGADRTEDALEACHATCP